MEHLAAKTSPDWSEGLDARLRALVVDLLATHELRHWQALVAELHPRVVIFAEATLRRALGGGWRLDRARALQLEEQALDVALRVCGDLRRDRYRRLALFEGLRSESGAPLRGYIAQITRKTAFRYLRGEVLRPDGGRREVSAEARSAGPVTLDRVASARGPNTSTRVARHIAARERELELLSVEQRAVFELYLHGYTASEIAEQSSSGLDAATVHRLLRAARAKLKYHFGQGGEGLS